MMVIKGGRDQLELELVHEIFMPGENQASEILCRLTPKGFGASMKIMEHNLEYVVFTDDGAYTARCLDVAVASEGGTQDEAIANLRDALVLYFDDHTAVM